VDPKAPLFGIVSRLNDLKGVDLVLENIPHLVGLGAQVAVVGRGDPRFERGFGQAAATRPGRVAFYSGQNEGLAHRVFAGADFVLVPSRMEPCGLVQLYAMRYGAVPIARFTGGLADTVRDESTGALATGLTFAAPDGFSLGAAITRAVHLYRADPARLRQLQRAGMARDSSWSSAALAYRAVYEELIE
jgi:starch synthase